MLENIAGVPEFLESFIGVIICIGAGFFAYVSSHMVEERRNAVPIDHGWERDERMQLAPPLKRSMEYGNMTLFHVLRLSRCDVFQSYLVASPMPPTPFWQ